MKHCGHAVPGKGLIWETFGSSSHELISRCKQSFCHIPSLLLANSRLGLLFQGRPPIFLCVFFRCLHHLFFILREFQKISSSLFCFGVLSESWSFLLSPLFLPRPGSVSSHAGIHLIFCVSSAYLKQDP